MNFKKVSYFLIVIAVAPFLFAFQADTPGEHLGFVGGGGQNLNYYRYHGAEASMDYWYFNIPFRYVSDDGNMAFHAVLTYMHMNHSTYTEMIKQANSIINEFRLAAYWWHDPSRYFGYSRVRQLLS